MLFAASGRAMRSKIGKSVLINGKIIVFEKKIFLMEWFQNFIKRFKALKWFYFYI